jgi:hypothetical protein
MPAQQNGRVEITLRDVYDSQQVTSGQLTAIGTQLATLTTRVDIRLDAGQIKMADLEQRIRSLEKFKYALAGATLVVSALSGTAATLIVFALSHR